MPPDDLIFAGGASVDGRPTIPSAALPASRPRTAGVRRCEAGAPTNGVRTTLDRGENPEPSPPIPAASVSLRFDECRRVPISAVSVHESGGRRSSASRRSQRSRCSAVSPPMPARRYLDPHLAKRDRPPVPHTLNCAMSELQDSVASRHCHHQIDVGCGQLGASAKTGDGPPAGST